MASKRWPSMAVPSRWTESRERRDRLGIAGAIPTSDTITKDLRRNVYLADSLVKRCQIVLKIRAIYR